MNAASRLCEIIAQGGKVSSGFYDGDRSFAALVQHGFLRKAGVLDAVVCDECSEAHSAPVVYEQLDHGYYCPELGLVKLAPEQVIAYRPDLPFLIGKLADLLDCEQRKATPLQDQTWRIGAFTAAHDKIMLYFHPRLQTEEDARQLQDTLSRHARSRWRLILTCQGAWPMADIVTAHLDQVVDLDPTTGALRLLEDPGTLAGAPRASTVGRPDQHGHLIKPLIEDRISTGAAATAIKAEARAVKAIFEAAYPGKPLPSDSTLQRYVRAARKGS
ncbi:hypothetical protein [Pseudooceanicola sp. 200-1SW]|uniref:hypothetical protein n=1 Tax=Pseudooceanicola sp. 200-1SW TaxID=3425949 RepID=UPI003D7FF080